MGRQDRFGDMLLIEACSPQRPRRASNPRTLFAKTFQRHPTIARRNQPKIPTLIVIGKRPIIFANPRMSRLVKITVQPQRRVQQERSDQLAWPEQPSGRIREQNLQQVGVRPDGRGDRLGPRAGWGRTRGARRGFARRDAPRKIPKFLTSPPPPAARTPRTGRSRSPR